MGWEDLSTGIFVHFEQLTLQTHTGWGGVGLEPAAPHYKGKESMQGIREGLIKRDLDPKHPPRFPAIA